MEDEFPVDKEELMRMVKREVSHEIKRVGTSSLLRAATHCCHALLPRTALRCHALLPGTTM